MRSPRASRPRLVLSVLATALMAGGFLLPACSSAQQDGPAEAGETEVLATVGGEEITEEDVRQRAEDELERAEMQLTQCKAKYERDKFDIFESNLESLVEDNLLETEAEERGITKDELVAAEIGANVAEVTDADVDAWYQQNQNRVRGTKEQLAPQITQFLQRERRQEARDAFISELKAGADVAYLLEPPRVEVEADGFPAKGPQDAPVTIVEFSDFECPFCARVVPTLERVKEEYGDQVRLVFRHFPLQMHANAPKAAEASMCAADQGKFWEMHDLLFEEQKQLAVQDLKAKAARLELDSEQFTQCLDSGEYSDEVQADMRAGAAAGVTGTPAMFINGRMISGAQPFEEVARVIEMELNRADGGDGSS